MHPKQEPGRDFQKFLVWDDVLDVDLASYGAGPNIEEAIETKNVVEYHGIRLFLNAYRNKMLGLNTVCFFSGVFRNRSAVSVFLDLWATQRLF